MRNLKDVIFDIQKVIPEEQEELIHELYKARREVYYVAPELQYLLWNKIFEILDKYVFKDMLLNYDNTTWKENVRKVWVGE